MDPSDKSLRESKDTISSNNKNVSVTGSTDPLNEEEERGQWGSPVEFILSCLGYAVGLGNVWRFPYMCYENGGGAFLIPYAIMLTFVGIPVFFIELSVGQYSASGPLFAFEASPLFRGVGIGMIIISFIGSIYYNMIIGYALYYLFASFQKVLPWSGCTNDFNTAYCYSKMEAEPCEKENGTWFNQTCYNSTYLASFDRPAENCTEFEDTTECYNYTANSLREYFKNLSDSKLLVSASEEYYNNEMLKRSPGIDDTGTMQWQLVLVLLLAWIMCFLCILKGIKSSGKVVYFTATFPYLVLIILFFRGVTLPGAGEGIKFYLIPKWEKLATGKVWVDAAGQIFFSLSVGMGGLMTFASYNKFHNNVYRDTLLVAIGNCLTSFFAGFVIFSILGYMAHELGVKVDEVATSGSGLAFIAYPEVVTRLPISQLWSVLFFFMLITLGLDSQFAGLENIQTAIVDSYPRLRKYKSFVALGLSISMFILGLTMVTNAGFYWLELMGYYSSGWSLVLIGMAECMVFAWAYGAKRLMGDIERMVGFKIYMHWWVCWVIITPLLLIAILIFNMIEFTPLSIGKYVYPQWAQTLGWLMALASVVPIPVFAVVELIRSYKNPEMDGLSLLSRAKALTQPSDNWMASIDKGKNAHQNNGYPMPENGNVEKSPYSITGQIRNEEMQSYNNPAFSTKL